jgi:hypothetical protein
MRERHPESNVAPEPASAGVLDSGYYERGLRARRDAHNLLDDVASVLADVESRADRVFFG